MSNCYLCGKPDSHTYDCPKFGALQTTSSSPIPVPPVVTTDPPVEYFTIKDKLWMIAIIKQGEVIPIWATHAWYLDGSELAEKGLTLTERALEWEKHIKERNMEEPRHTLRDKGYSAGRRYPGWLSYEMLVFGLVS